MTPRSEKGNDEPEIERRYKMKNMSFEMTVNGRTYSVNNGNGIDGVKVVDMQTGKCVTVRESGCYANKGGVRKAILSHAEDFEVTEDEMITRAEYEAEMLAERGISMELLRAEHEAEVSMEMESRHGEYEEAFERACAEIQAENEEPEVEEPEVEVTEAVIVNTINDVIFRNLPKYVQKAIDYCDYVDGVYRIHVNTEFGSREIVENKWVDASKSVKQFCKTGLTA